MRFQPNRDYDSNDDIQTPLDLAQHLVAHFQPGGRILEPCCGDGNILCHLPADADWCEIKHSRNFFSWHESVDWIITNPPWSQIRCFLAHGFQIADNIVFLMTVNHAWTKARLRDMRNAGFGLREIHLVSTPHSFPQSGFQLGAVHYQRGHFGPLNLTYAAEMFGSDPLQMAARAGIEPATK